MASYYVWSGATGSANGTTWTNAYTTLSTALTGKSAGDVFYVAHDHAESTGASVSLNAVGGTEAGPNLVICVNRAGSVPPVSADRRATATVAVSGAFGITFSGIAHYDGIIFNVGVGSSSSATQIQLQSQDSKWLRFDNCATNMASTSVASHLNIATSGTGVGGVSIEFNNTTVSFSSTAQTIKIMDGALKWRNTASAVTGATIPTVMFTPATGRSGSVECIGVDFSALGSGKTIMGAANAALDVRGMFIDCKLNASVTLSTAPLQDGGSAVDFVRSSSSGNYAVRRHRVSGLLTEEITIVRSGGASDGTTPISWKVVTTSTSSYSKPFECPPIAIWNDTTGSAKTATIECIWGGGAVPNDDEIWVDVEYLGSSTSPQGSFVNDGKADLLATAAGQTASSATWGGSTTKFKLNVTFTPQQKGWLYARIKCGKASSTFYCDPLITLT